MVLVHHQVLFSSECAICEHLVQKNISSKYILSEIGPCRQSNRVCLLSITQILKQLLLSPVEVVRTFSLLQDN